MKFTRHAVKEIDQPRYMLAGENGHAMWVLVPLNASLFNTEQDALNAIEMYRRIDSRSFQGRSIEVVKLEIEVKVIE